MNKNELDERKRPVRFSADALDVPEIKLKEKLDKQIVGDLIVEAAPSETVDCPQSEKEIATNQAFQDKSRQTQSELQTDLNHVKDSYRFDMKSKISPLRIPFIISIVLLIAKTLIDAAYNLSTFEYTIPICILSLLAATIATTFGATLLVHNINPRWYRRIPSSKTPQHLSILLAALGAPLLLSTTLATSASYLNSPDSKPIILIANLTALESLFSPSAAVLHAINSRNKAIFTDNVNSNRMQALENILLNNAKSLPNENPAGLLNYLDKESAATLVQELRGTPNKDAMRKLLIWESQRSEMYMPWRLDLSIAAANMNNPEAAALLQFKSFNTLKPYVMGYLCVPTKQVDSLARQLSPALNKYFKNRCLIGTLQNNSLTLLDERTYIIDARTDFKSKTEFATANTILPLIKSLSKEKQNANFSLINEINPKRLDLLDDQAALTQKIAAQPPSNKGPTQAINAASLLPQTLVLISQEQYRLLVDEFGEEALISTEEP